MTAAVALAVAVGCTPKPVEHVPLPSVDGSFVRFPYVQNVGTTAATVIWMRDGSGIGRADEADSLRYRDADAQGPWKTLQPVDRGLGVRAATLEDLRPGAPIEYEVFRGDEAAGPFRFRTAPEPGGRDSTRVLLFGDTGWGSDGQLQLARLMDRTEWDLAIHVGDIAYYDGTETDFTDRHFRVYEELLSRTPMFASVGNHDVRTEEGAAYDRAFDWPVVAPGTRYYAFRWNRTQFVVLDTSSHTDDVTGLFRGTGRQYEWLEETLRTSMSDPEVDWVVVYGHHPPYSHAVGISGHGQERDLRNRLTPLLDRYGVDIMAAGHDHHYERSFAVRDGRPVPDGCGPVYIVQGAGGASRYARDVASSPIQAFGSRAYSFTELLILGDRVQGRTFGIDGDVIDEFVIRPYDGPGSVDCDD